MKKFPTYSLPLSLVILLSGCGASHESSNNIVKGFHLPPPLSTSQVRKLKEELDAPVAKWVQVGGTLSPVAGGAITGIAVASNGTIYASTQQRLWDFEKNNWSSVSLPISFSQTSSSIDKLGMLNTNTLIVGTILNGIYLDDAGNWVQPTNVELGSVQSIQETPPNYAVVTTMNHTYEFNGSTWVSWHTYSSFFNKGLTGAGVVAPNGVGYLPTSAGLYQLASTGWTPVGGPTNPIASRNILGVNINHAGSVIAYAAGLGVVQYNENHWSLLGGPKNLSEASIFYSPQGTLVVAGSTRIAEEHKNHWSIISVPQSLTIKQMAITPDGSLIIATSNGVWAYTTKPASFTAPVNTVPSPSSSAALPPLSQSGAMVVFHGSLKQLAQDQAITWQKDGVPIKAFASQLPGPITGLNLRYYGEGGFKYDFAPTASVLQSLKTHGATWWILAFHHRTSMGSLVYSANDIALFRNKRLVWLFPLSKSEMTMGLEFSPTNVYPSLKALRLITPSTIQVHFFNISIGGSGGMWTSITDHWNIKTNTMVSIRNKTYSY